MRRLIAMGAVAILALAAVPLTNAGSTAVTRHVDGNIIVSNPGPQTWMARFEVRTGGDAVQFGYLELFGIGGDVVGQIHEFAVYKVDYFKSPSGAQGATLWMSECRIIPAESPCTDTADAYSVIDGSAIGQNDTFMGTYGWTVDSGNLSIYSTGGQNTQ